MDGKKLWISLKTVIIIYLEEFGKYSKQTLNNTSTDLLFTWLGLAWLGLVGEGGTCFTIFYIKNRNNANYT